MKTTKVLVTFIIIILNTYLLEAQYPLSINKDSINFKIKELLKNPDSLFTLVENCCSYREFENSYRKLFVDSIACEMQKGYFVQYDQWEKVLEIDQERKISEYYFLRISANSHPDYNINLFFMKQNDEWKFIDFKFKEDPFFGKIKVTILK